MSTTARAGGPGTSTATGMSTTGSATAPRSSAMPTTGSMRRRCGGCRSGGVFALSTERELAVADRIARMVPAAELVRFSNSGTEAVMSALRLARAFTGRESYLLVEGGYHGLFDAAMWQADVEGWQAGSNADPEVIPYGKGIPPTVRKLVHLTPMNDAQRLEDVFRRHGDSLAAMLIEPIQGNCCGILARADYVHLARRLCDQYGVMLIIDEVKSGFRVGKSGIQGILGVKPDITTFAKAMGNGYPIAVVAGREDVMRTFRYGGASHGGTYTAHSVSLGGSRGMPAHSGRDARAGDACAARAEPDDRDHARS